MMAAGPVKAITLPAPRDRLEPAPQGGRQCCANPFLVDRLEQPVTHHAARERRKRFAEIQSCHDLEELAPGIDVSDPVAMRDVGTLEQAPITREDDAFLRCRARHNIRIRSALISDGIETEQPQIARELRQVHIQHEARFA